MSTAATLNRNERNAATVAAVLDQTRSFIDWLEANGPKMPAVWATEGVVTDLILCPDDGDSVADSVAWLTTDGGLSDPKIVGDIYRCVMGVSGITFDGDRYAVTRNGDRVSIARSWGNCSVVIQVKADRLS